LAGEAVPVPPPPPNTAVQLQNYWDDQNRSTTSVDGDLLTLLTKRNDSWKSLGGVRIDVAFAENDLYFGVLPDNRGVYLHAGSKGQMTLARVFPENGREIVAARAKVELSNAQAPPVEYAIATIVDEENPDLAKLAAWLSAPKPSRSEKYVLLVPWQHKENAESEPVELGGTEREPLSSIVFAVRTAHGNADNRYAMLAFREVEWKAAPRKLR